MHLNWVIQSKGGAGKSVVAAFLADYFQDAGASRGPSLNIDLDPSNQSLASYEALAAKHVQIAEGNQIVPRKFDAIMAEALTGTEPQAVIDTGSTAFLSLVDYLERNRFFARLAQQGHTSTIHVPVHGGQRMLETIKCLAKLIEDFQEPRFVVWLNPYFGPVESLPAAKSFQDMKAYKDNANRIVAVMEIPTLYQDQAESLGICLNNSWTFRQALETLSEPVYAMDKFRLLDIQSDLSSQLDKLFEPAPSKPGSSKRQAKAVHAE